jgi:hypothetical protein
MQQSTKQKILAMSLALISGLGTGAGTVLATYEAVTAAAAAGGVGVALTGAAAIIGISAAGVASALVGAVGVYLAYRDYREVDEFLDDELKKLAVIEEDNKKALENSIRDYVLQTLRLGFILDQKKKTLVNDADPVSVTAELNAANAEIEERLAKLEGLPNEFKAKVFKVLEKVSATLDSGVYPEESENKALYDAFRKDDLNQSQKDALTLACKAEFDEAIRVSRFFPIAPMKAGETTPHLAKPEKLPVVRASLLGAFGAFTSVSGTAFGLTALLVGGFSLAAIPVVGWFIIGAAIGAAIIGGAVYGYYKYEQTKKEAFKENKETTNKSQTSLTAKLDTVVYGLKAGIVSENKKIADAKLAKSQAAELAVKAELQNTNAALVEAQKDQVAKAAATETELTKIKAALAEAQKALRVERIKRTFGVQDQPKEVAPAAASVNVAVADNAAIQRSIGQISRSSSGSFSFFAPKKVVDAVEKPVFGEKAAQESQTVSALVLPPTVKCC